MKEIVINNEQARTFALSLIRDLPLSPAMQIKISEYRKKRTNEQNSLQWVSMLADFAEQAIVDGRKFSDQAWHELLKTQFLPPVEKEGITLPGYKKWLELPDGTLKLVGSTTKLTTKGMAEYLTECYAFGAQELGIKFKDHGHE